MPKKRSPTAQVSPRREPSSVLRRALAGGLVLVVLLTVSGLLAYLTRVEHPGSTGSSAAPPPLSSRAASPPASPQPTDGVREAVGPPPRTSDPVTFAKAATEVLWSYDTRTSSRAAYVSGLKRWMTGEEKYADWESVSGQIPDPLLWSRMHDERQHASAEVGEGHFPQSFKTALAEDPGALTEAYVYAVTVSGKQTIAWKHSGAGAESRSVTLAVQCRPGRACALVGVLPNVAP